MRLTLPTCGTLCAGLSKTAQVAQLVPLPMMRLLPSPHTRVTWQWALLSSVLQLLATAEVGEGRTALPMALPMALLTALLTAAVRGLVSCPCLCWS